MGETSAATCITNISDNSTSVVGPPQMSACIRLRDWEEGGYRAADLDDKKIEEDFVTIDGIRYFCTGDIGQYNKDGNLQIIDRKKDLVKLQMGEYVALSKVENVVKNSKYTELPMTYADPNKDYCIVLICPMEGALNELAKSLNVAGDKAALCKDPKIIENVTADVQAVCKGKLQKFEVPKKVILIDDLCKCMRMPVHTPMHASVSADDVIKCAYLEPNMKRARTLPLTCSGKSHPSTRA